MNRIIFKLELIHIILVIMISLYLSIVCITLRHSICLSVLFLLYFPIHIHLKWISPSLGYTNIVAYSQSRTNLRHRYKYRWPSPSIKIISIQLHYSYLKRRNSTVVSNKSLELHSFDCVHSPCCSPNPQSSSFAWQLLLIVISGKKKSAFRSSLQIPCRR